MAEKPARDALILIVDDDADVRDSIASLLEAYGYRSITVPDVASAQAALGVCDPDVVLCDIYMPIADGYELIVALRSTGHTIPIVAMSAAHLDQDTLGYAKKLGADAIVFKPFRDWELMEALDHCLAATGR